jgi:plastocyanin
MTRWRQQSVVAFACLGAAVGVLGAASARGQGQIREFAVTGNDFTFAPARLEVQKDDLVKITFTASDMPHSFTLDNYRIAKRAGAGQSVTFEFRAGTHQFYCNLTQDDRCRNMRGQLVVR